MIFLLHAEDDELLERLLEMILIFYPHSTLLRVAFMMMLLWRHKKFYLRMLSSPFSDGVRELDRI